MADFIKALIGPTPNILLVYDTMQSEGWRKNGRAGRDVATDKLLSRLEKAGVQYEEISIVSLSDVPTNPKASDFKFKLPYVQELIETYSFNVIVPVGAAAFEKITGLKGAAKYFGHALISEVYPGQKILPCPNPSAIKYDPGVALVLDRVIKLAVTEKEFPDLREGEKLETHYAILDTLPKIRKWFEYYRDHVDLFAYDLETTGFQFNRDEITTIQFSHKPGYSYLIPCRTAGEWPAAPYKWSDEEWAEILGMLKELFADPGKRIGGHNKKFDDKFINFWWGIPLQKGRSLDTMIASFLCDENSPNGLKELACQLTDLGDYELGLEKFKDAYCKKHKVLKKASTKNPDKPVFSYGMVPFDILADYALKDTDATIRLWYHFEKEMEKEGVRKTFDMLMRITWLLTRFEQNGWSVDVPYGEQLAVKMREEIAELEQKLLQHPEVKKASMMLEVAKLRKENEKRVKKLADLKDPFVFNFNSPAQKATLFFEVLKFEVVSRSKKTKLPSTDKEALSTWMRTQPKHREFLKDLQYYGELTKFLGTYVVGILSKTINGRVHPSFNPIGAKTGRTSSQNPNFQNIPARGDDRKMKLVKAIKRMMKAPDGKLMLGADLSAIEMVWAAIISGDTKLIEIFNEGLDIHGSVAKELFDYIECHPNEVKKLYEFERNSVSKTVQFLSIYGGGPDALQKKVNESVIERQEMAKAKGQELNLQEYTLAQAEEVLKNYFKKYQGVSAHIKSTEAFAKKHGYALSVYGYKRRVPAAQAKSDHDDRSPEQERALRQAVNFTIQNPASVSLLLSICNLQEEIDELVEKGELKADDYILMGTCHDANYCQVSENLILYARDLLLKYMTIAPIPNCPVPIRAEAEWGKDWASFTEDFGAALVEEEEIEDDDEEEELDEVA